MATLALAAAGAAAGSALLPGGLSLLGATIGGATIGAQAGALAGAFVDQSLFGAAGPGRSISGPRLSDLRVMTSTEGAPIPRVYGRARIGGQVIWASDFEEEVATSEAGGGGKGGGGGSASVSQTTYAYYANFAVALCAGEISGIGRIWADGREIDLTTIAFRLHTGGETQNADSLLVARLGADAPAFRGTAYVVFERLALAPFGNRLPQLSFEVFRGADDLARLVRGVVLIPGSGEFVASPTAVTRIGFAGDRVAENIHNGSGLVDSELSLDQLQAELPRVVSVSLVTSWFGSDLRCGHCRIEPKVEIAAKDTAPLSWSVAGLTRSTAAVVSRHAGRAAYGGTPSDQTIVDQIRSLVARGLSVTLNPFVLMDVASDNSLPNPLDGGAAQPAYPWRGRITCDPAPGRPGSPDKTAAAASQIDSFVGTAQPADFALAGDAVVYSGPAEWSYRRFILHHAWLAKAAGGVSAFLIGSELRGLTTVRALAASYPFVSALKQLAADVRSILGPAVKITYAADWSEYFGHQPADGSGDVRFHLDPLWASPAIDAVAIDVYWPLADWREGDTHLDRLAGARSTYDLAYLKSNITGGEGFDWYYASSADREAQRRTPITDGGAAKPWMFRYKDLKSWWSNPHFDRSDGIEATTPTAWVPQGKPVWFMETGCGAVDKAANEPNVFIDPKSAETALPHFSSGRRDDLVQRRYIQALLEAFDATSGGAIAGLNPVSAVYGGTMVDVARTHVYAWDLRPFPAFPADVESWGDGPGWRLGHWLNGRTTAMPLAELVAHLARDFAIGTIDAGALEGLVPGYVVDRIMSLRDALQPLELACFIDSVESGGVVRMRQRGMAAPAIAIDDQQTVESRPGAPTVTLVRAQEGDLPATAKISFIAGEGDYQQAVVEARKLARATDRVAQADLPMVLDSDAARQLADTWLHEAWVARERFTLELPPSRLAIEPGDTLSLTVDGREHLLRVTEVGDHGARSIEARSFASHVYAGVEQPERPRPVAEPVASGTPEIVFLDLPPLTGEEPATAAYLAAAQSPWPGPLAIYRSPEDSGFTLQGFVNAASVVGMTLDTLPAGPEGRFDRATRLRVAISTSAALSSVSPAQLLAGSNTAAIEGADGLWEIIQFERAELIAEGVYVLSDLLRGQAGSEAAMHTPTVPAGRRFVLLGPSVQRLDLASADVALPFNWRVGPASRSVGSPTYAQAVHAFAGIGGRPFSPVHIRGRRSGGDLSISWIRRTRSGGDAWSAGEVPLAEDVEAYAVDIMDGGSVKRTITTATPSAAYSAADQIADFGATQPSVTVRICQVSAVWGRGTARNATL